MKNRSFNAQVAEQLREIADLLEQQAANPFRINAYRHAATTVDDLGQDLQNILSDHGMAGLMALPNIGPSIGRAIYEIYNLGRSTRLESLRGELDPVHLFCTIPGIGPATARQIHEYLHVETLESLEIAAHDGRLEQIPGVGLRRAAAIRAALNNMLGQRFPHGHPQHPVPIEFLLDVDQEYRDKAHAGILPTMAPRRFNPEGRSWLPVLHTKRGEWHFTALYSNTARAHRLERTHDWVVISCYDESHHEDQNTVVTETQGPLNGRRVVRGREPECARYYAQP
jgi:putative hydrolase